MRAPSQREQAMLAAAFVVFVGTTYWSGRFRPTLQQIRQEAQASQPPGASKDREPLDPEQARSRIAEMEKEWEQLGERLTQARADLGKKGRTFVPLDQPGLLQELKVEISTLATECEVQIRENEPYTYELSEPAPAAVSGAQSPFQMGAVLAAQYKRSFQRLTMECSYVGLRAFIGHLGTLSYPVVPVDFEVQALSPMGRVDPSQRLSVKLILAL